MAREGGHLELILNGVLWQVCLWCWHQIKNEYNGLCPACRTPYSEISKQKNTLDREECVT